MHKNNELFYRENLSKLTDEQQGILNWAWTWYDKEDGKKDEYGACLYIMHDLYRYCDKKWGEFIANWFKQEHDIAYNDRLFDNKVWSIAKSLKGLIPDDDYDDLIWHLNVGLADCHS